MLLNSKTKGCKPNPKHTPNPVFVVSTRTKKEYVIRDENGKEIEKIYKSVNECKVVPSSEYANEGITEDMFSVDNLQAAGFNPQVITKPLICSTLEQRGETINMVDSPDFENYVNENCVTNPNNSSNES